jgi:crotonobetainyl-CoA:carnitine CoA-transferase CaiB-like acyl-CoA transferase
MTATPGRIRWPGRPHGRDTAAVLAEIGVDGAALAELRARGVA